MARKALRFVRAAAAAVAAYIGPAGEPVYNTTTGDIHLQNGVDAGGVPLASAGWNNNIKGLFALAFKDTGNLPGALTLPPGGTLEYLNSALADRVKTVNVLSRIPPQYHAAIKDYTIADNVDLWLTIQNCINLGEALSFPDGKYPISKPLLARSGTRMYGSKPISPVFSKTGVGYFPKPGEFEKYTGACIVKTTNQGLPDLKSYKNGENTPTDLSNVNAVLISAATEFPWIVQDTVFVNIGFFGTAAATEANRPDGHYQFSTAWVKHAGCYAAYCKTGFSSFDAFLQIWENVKTRDCSDIGFQISATSNAMLNCYAIGGRIGFRIDGQYHSLVGCAADSQSDIAYWLNGIRGTRIDGGTEGSHGNKLRMDNVSAAVIVLHSSGNIPSGTSWNDFYTGGSTAGLTATDVKASVVYGPNSSAQVSLFMRSGDGFRPNVPVDIVYPTASVVYLRGFPGLPNDRQDWAMDVPRGVAADGISTLALLTSYSDNNPSDVSVLDVDARLTLHGKMMHVLAQLDLSRLGGDSVRFSIGFRNPLGDWLEGAAGRYSKGEYLASGALNPFGVKGSNRWASQRPGAFTTTVKLSWAGSSWTDGKTLQPPIWGGMDHRTGNIYFFRPDGTHMTLSDILAIGKYLILEGYYLISYQ